MDRNPNWDPNTDWRPAYLDKVDIQEGFADTVSAGEEDPERQRSGERRLQLGASR